MSVSRILLRSIQLAGFCLLSMALPAWAQDSVLARIQRQGVLRCGVDATPGFHAADLSGRPVGFDADLCRAVAAVALGSGSALETIRISTRLKFAALTKGEIDLALGQATWTLGRDTGLGIAFPTWVLLDAQGFLVWTDRGIAKLDDLAGKKICVQAGTTSEANLRDTLAARQISATLVPGATSEEKNQRFSQRGCDAVSGDRFELAALRANLPDGRGQFRLLDETISREPLAPVIVGGDKQWFDIVRWTMFALMIAEHRGITRAIANDDAAIAKIEDPEARRLLGLGDDYGQPMGLDRFWARRAIAAVGHYGEIYDRNLGQGAPLGLPRGVNALWNQGGLLLPPPLR